jgi:hypothetical protein
MTERKPLKREPKTKAEPVPDAGGGCPQYAAQSQAAYQAEKGTILKHSGVSRAIFAFADDQSG